MFDLGIQFGMEKVALKKPKFVSKLIEDVAKSRAQPHKAGPFAARMIGQAMNRPKTWAAGTAAAVTPAVATAIYMKKKKK